MKELGLSTEIVDQGVYDNTVAAFAEKDIVLPTFEQLADPSLIPEEIKEKLKSVDPDAADPLNLFRVHWFNSEDRRGTVDVPGYISLPKELTGVDAPIVIALGDRFPMIDAHKVLAAYGGLAPRVLTGQFDPTAHRAIWPSTGNYCRGGVAISRIMECRGVAVLPELMSQERFDWLDKWATDPANDVIRTPGCESNVKEIYDACNELSLDAKNVIFNQFSEFGNHLVHYAITGRALEMVFEDLKKNTGRDLTLSAFISSTGSAGTIAAGDYLKDKYDSRTVALEALECPTILYNGFGEHNIQGIGDKHLPLIHNAMETDFAAALSDVSTDQLLVLFNTDEGRRYLIERRGLDADLVDSLKHLGISSIANVIGAIKMAKYLKLGPDDAIITVATDGAAMYHTERDMALEKYFPNGFDQISAGETFARFLMGADIEHLMELTQLDRERVFNLGYFTWVEQQGISFEAFMARRKKSFWVDMRSFLPAWDKLIDKFNHDVKER